MSFRITALEPEISSDEAVNSAAPMSSTDRKIENYVKRLKCSDEGFDEELLGHRTCTVAYSRQASIPVISMTIACTNKNIKGSTLIEIAHDQIQKIYFEIIDAACEYEKDIGGAVISVPREENGVISIEAGKDWFMSLGGWKGMMPSEEIKEYFFYVPGSLEKGEKFRGVRIFQQELVFELNNHRIHIPKGFSINNIDITKAWEKKGDVFIEVPMGKTDLSYPQIFRAIETIKSSFNFSDSQIATLQLGALSHEMDLPVWFEHETPAENRKEVLIFLDYLNGLMFGVEASGLNAALATGLMTLDLIAKGRLDYKMAFYANQDGGIYPYASFGNNRGTYSEREKILLHRKENQDSFSMKEYRENPSLSPVATKEALLIKQWLECNDVIQEYVSFEEQVKLINKAIGILIHEYFFAG